MMRIVGILSIAFILGRAEAGECNAPGTTACFKVTLADASVKEGVVLSDAKGWPAGADYGVNVTFHDKHTAIFALIWDDDGDYLVTVGADSKNFCTFDTGAQIDPYLNLMQQQGFKCKFTLTGTVNSSSGYPTYEYTLMTEKGTASDTCGHKALTPPKIPCPTPPQPPQLKKLARMAKRSKELFV